MSVLKLLPVPSTPDEIAALLHEAIVVGHHAGEVVVSRRRPFIPCGTDPADINRECDRRYAVRDGIANSWSVREVDPVYVVPFVDVAARIAADDVRANAAQRANVKPKGDA